jgi:hypothetical protein
MGGETRSCRRGSWEWVGLGGCGVELRLAEGEVEVQAEYGEEGIREHA